MSDGCRPSHGTFLISSASTVYSVSYSEVTTVRTRISRRFDHSLMLKPFIAADSSRDLQASPFGAMAGGGAPAAGPGAPDYNKLFTAEKENLEFAEGQYDWVCNGVEQRVLEQWGKLPPSSTSSTTKIKHA